MTCILLAAAMFALVATNPAAAADKLRIGKAANAWTFIPVNVGAEVGTFPRYGIEVEIFNLPNDAKLQQALASDSVDIRIIGGPTMAQSVKGSPVVAVAAFGNESRL